MCDDDLLCLKKFGKFAEAMGVISGEREFFLFLFMEITVGGLEVK